MTCIDSGVDIRPYTMLEKIEPGVCHAYNIWNEAHKEVFEVDTVVLCTQRQSRTTSSTAS